MSDLTPPLCQQISYPQVKQVVHDFYQQLVEHPQLGAFFKPVEDFTAHEQRISDFWWIIMGGKPEPRPQIDMIGKHMPLGIEETDLDLWLSIFEQTLNTSLDEVTATEWMNRAEQIAQRLRQMINYGKSLGIQIETSPQIP